MIPRLVWSLLSRRRYPGWRDRLATIHRVHALAPDAFAAWQAEALGEHLRWARETIPFHRERVTAGARLEDFPILDRATVQRQAEALRDPTRPAEALLREASGGSTGEPVVVYQDEAYRTWDHATEHHVFELWGLQPWCRMGIVWGSDEDLREMPARERMWERLMHRELVNAFHMGEAQLEEAAGRLERLRPVYLLGYASALALLAAWLLEHRPDHGIRPRVVRSSAETLTPNVRALVTRALGARVYDFYGSRESASIAVECTAGHLHVQGHARVVEIVDAEGRPAPPGTPGRLLVTDLTNRAFGLIRYATGDVSSWAEGGACPCGSPYPRLARIHGRTSDFITTAAGERVHGEWFTHLFYERKGVHRFQIYQPRLGRVEVRTVGPAREEELADILGAIGDRMGSGVEVVWERVQEIPTTRSGKQRFTLSDVPYLPVAS